MITKDNKSTQQKKHLNRDVGAKTARFSYNQVVRNSNNSPIYYIINKSDNKIRLNYEKAVRK